MPVSAHIKTARRQPVRILSVDPRSKRIEALLKDGAIIQIASFGGSFIERWPKVDEMWMIEYINGFPQLIGYIELAGETSVPMSDLEPGEARVEADKTVFSGDVEIKGTLVGVGVVEGAVTWNSITDKPTTFVPSEHTHAWDSITGKPETFAPSVHTHAWDSITSKPETFTPSVHSHDWGAISNKPATFAPSAHTHDWAEITNTPTAIAPPLVTTLPDSPANNEVVDYLVTDQFAGATSVGVIWNLRYRSNIVSTYKWSVMGHQSLYLTTTSGFVTCPTGSGSAVSTGMPVVKVPLSGIYRIRWGFYVQETAGATGYNRIRATAHNITASVGIGPTTNVVLGGSGFIRGFIVGEQLSSSAVAANAEVTIRYWQDNASPSFAPLELAWLEVIPIRLLG